MPTWSVEVENLTRSFGNFVAVDHITFRVGGAEHIVDLGGRRTGRTITFAVPRASLMRAVEWEIFDDLLIGNFGNGRIHAFVPAPAGEFEDHGPLHSTAGRPIEIPGLWALQFGNGAAAGPKTTLFFTSGPFDEQHGLFGSLVVAHPPGHNP